MQLLDGIPYSPLVLPSEWCSKQPCWEISGIIINQPTSSIIVYLAALFGLYVGWKLCKDVTKQKSKQWFGISLMLGGIGAFLAGTSYQTFGYEIKCAGREICNWTSWWELGYELTTVVAVAYLLVAVVKMCFAQKWLRPTKIFVVVFVASYLLTLAIGVVLENQFLLSFELMLLFSAPFYVFFLIVNGIQYVKTRNRHIAKLGFTWLILFGVLVTYFAYMMMGLTQTLWAHGIWFSENDVLHVGMILWLTFIHFVLSDGIQDNILI